MQILRTAIFSFILFGVANLFSQETSFLDVLVKNGVLTNEEALFVKKESSSLVLSSRPETKKFAIGGRIQAQYEYEYTESDVGSRRGSSGFSMRRIYVEAKADLGSGWGAKFGVDLARNRLTSFLVDNLIEKSFDGEYLSGTLAMGYMKPYFGYEDTISPFRMEAIEYSAASHYWVCAQTDTRLGIGNRYMGLRWNGKVKQLEGLTYTLALTNSFQLSPIHEPELEYNWRDNHFAYWLSIAYAFKLSDVDVSVGMHSMYSSGANKKLGQGGASAVYSINPYITVNWGNFSAWAEFLASVVADGRRTSTGEYQQASPYGVNLCLEYRFPLKELGALAPNFRYSHLDTGGRGARVADVVRNAANLGGLYNCADDFYLGLNWYIKGNDLRFQVGYGYAELSGYASSSASPSNHRANVHYFRMQIQTQF